MTQARGEIGTASLVTLLGRKKFLERWKSTIMSHQIMEMLTPEVQIAIKLHKAKYQWIDPLPNETIDDGRSLLNEVLKLIRPDVQTNVYAKLAKIKTIKPVDYAFNIIKWHSAMESKRISITNKVPGAYHESQSGCFLDCQSKKFQSRSKHPSQPIPSWKSRPLDCIVHLW